VLDRERQISETRIRLCLDCGKCTVVCPVARYDPEFNPRLIAQRMLTRRAGDNIDDQIWSCLSCYVCVERCNYSVRFPEFVHAVRAEALSEGTQAQCSHGGALQALQHLMARADLEQNRLGWLPDDVEVTEGADTVFFVGCAPYFDVVFGELEISTLDGVKSALRLLNRARIPFALLAEERCCGRDLLHQGDLAGFAALAKTNQETFASRGVKRIITNCPECRYTLEVDYPRVVGETGIEVLHLSEVIAPLLESGELTAGGLRSRVTYHDPCTLGRCSRVFDQPRQILSALEGLELVEMEQNREKSLCCGASPWVHCGAVNRQIQRERLAQARATGASTLVTACPKCEIHLRCAQKSEDSGTGKLEIKDLASLAAGSSGREGGDKGG
jgi:heterodisulfide reductase subunit D